MKTRPALLRSIGVLMALVVFASLPTATLAVCSPAWEPYCELYYGQGTNLCIEVETDCPPSGATIFYTATLDQPNTNDPCHNGANPCLGTNAVPSGTCLSVPYGHTLNIRMIAWKSGVADSPVVACEQHNPNW